MHSKSKVYFFFNKVRPKLENRSKLKGQIEALFRHEGRQLDSINYIFCSDADLLKINQLYLDHDYYTDIITFDLSERAGIVAEVYISIDRVRENARSVGNYFGSEIRRVIFHGALHLCGYSDKTQTSQQKMRNREDHYLQKFWRSPKSVSRGTL